GYIERYAESGGGNARLLRLTRRGRQLYERIEAVAAAVEAEWAREIGSSRLEELRTILTDLLAARQDRHSKRIR
ncbi:MAG: hypothetical protein LBV34_19135, partial [Nocardiopsaceae bacterium]|nr:hypothetical protein [Nocardiopsaceae bacterium]